MTKSKKTSNQQDFSKDFKKIMKKAPKSPLPFNQPQWVANGDFFVKFSLYHDIPSIASTHTSLFQS